MLVLIVQHTHAYTHRHTFHLVSREGQACSVVRTCFGSKVIQCHVSPPVGFYGPIVSLPSCDLGEHVITVLTLNTLSMQRPESAGVHVAYCCTAAV